MALTNSPDLLPGTLDLLILRTLRQETLHGYAIVQRIKVTSSDVLQVGESSLYPALQRLLAAGFVSAEWGASDNNRRARFYTITTTGVKRLKAESAAYERMSAAIAGVLRTA